MAVLFQFVRSDEVSKLIVAGLLVFAFAAFAVASAMPKIRSPKWWHWILVGVLVCPAIVSVILLR